MRLSSRHLLEVAANRGPKLACGLVRVAFEAVLGSFSCAVQITSTYVLTDIYYCAAWSGRLVWVANGPTYAPILIAVAARRRYVDSTTLCAGVTLSEHV